MINRGLWKRLDTWSAAELFDLRGFSGPVGGSCRSKQLPAPWTASQGAPQEEAEAWGRPEEAIQGRPGVVAFVSGAPGMEEGGGL